MALVLNQNDPSLIQQPHVVDQTCILNNMLLVVSIFFIGDVNSIELAAYNLVFSDADCRHWTPSVAVINLFSQSNTALFVHFKQVYHATLGANGDQVCVVLGRDTGDEVVMCRRKVVYVYLVAFVELYLEETDVENSSIKHNKVCDKEATP